MVRWRVAPPALATRTQRTLSIAPAVAQSFELEASGWQVPVLERTTSATPAPTARRARRHPGARSLRTRDGVAIRAGVIGGMATALHPARRASHRRARASGATSSRSCFTTTTRDLRVVGQGAEPGFAFTNWPLGNGDLKARVGTPRQPISTSTGLLLLLPVLMWIAAALITWLLVSRLLLRPLKRLERAVRDYRPGPTGSTCRASSGRRQEIQQLRDAFARAITRVDESEREMTGALEGQRRLVREVHHRVKNNLQVIASLLNIHGRSAEAPEARAAYAGISRRVGALVDRSPQPFRGDGGKSRDRASAADFGACGGIAGRRARRGPRD